VIRGLRPIWNIDDACLVGPDSHADDGHLAKSKRNVEVVRVSVGVFGSEHVRGILDFWASEFDTDKLLTAPDVRDSIELWLTVHPLPPETLFGTFSGRFHRNGRKKKTLFAATR